VVCTTRKSKLGAIGGKGSAQQDLDLLVGANMVVWLAWQVIYASVSHSSIAALLSWLERNRGFGDFGSYENDTVEACSMIAISVTLPFRTDRCKPRCCIYRWLIDV
jgi:hypothetical protein